MGTIHVLILLDIVEAFKGYRDVICNHSIVNKNTFSLGYEIVY